MRSSRLMRAAPVFAIVLASAPCGAGAEADPAFSAPGVEQRVFNAALETIAPSMVRVDTIGGALPVAADKDEQGREVASPTFRQADGPTTGVVWSDDGYIVSSSINFMREPSVTTVTLSDGRRLVATLVARDRGARLALLKVNATDLTPPRLAPAEFIRVGQWALAAGFGHATRTPAVTAGVVSGLARTRGLTIQTDAKISPANYGGPLFDIEGRLLGVCVPRAGDNDGELAGIEWYDSGIGFAVTTDVLASRIERLKQGRDLDAGMLGLVINEDAPFVGSTAPVGIEIREVPPGTPGADAGIRAEDRILELDGHPTPRPIDLYRAVAAKTAGDEIAVTLLRQGERIEVRLQVLSEKDLIDQIRAAASQPASQPASSSPAIENLIVPG